MTCISKITYFSEPAEDSANGSISACDETNSKDENSAGPIESPLGKNDYDFCFSFQATFIFSLMKTMSRQKFYISKLKDFFLNLN